MNQTNSQFVYVQLNHHCGVLDFVFAPERQLRFGNSQLLAHNLISPVALSKKE